MFSKILPYILITRPANFIITFLSIFIACLICADSIKIDHKWFLASLAGGLVAAAGNIINDIYDIEIDRINRPARILPSGKLSIKEAWLFYFLLNIFAVFLAFTLNMAAFVIVVFSIFVVFIYSYKLKRIPLLGNFIVAFMTGLAFIFGGVVVDNWQYAIIPAVFALTINFIREIIKDMEDIEGDKKNNVLTYPVRYGFKASIYIVTFFSIVLIILTFFPFLLEMYKIEYFIVVMLSVNTLMIVFLKMILISQDKFILHRSSLLLKANMIFGLIAIYFGK